MGIPPHKLVFCRSIFCAFDLESVYRLCALELFSI